MMQVEIRSYGQYQKEDYREILIHNGDVTIGFSDLGARITRWEVRDTGSIVLGLIDAQACFQHRGYYYGATVGRVAGRIAKGQFTLNGKDYQLEANEGANHLHGGQYGLDLQKWTYDIQQTPQSVRIAFYLVDAYHEGSYPGEVAIQVVHTYTVENEWQLEIKAQATEDTLFNATNHVYFNLNGNIKEGIQNHRLYANVEAYAELLKDGIPSGNLIPVENTDFDLNQNPLMANVIKSSDPQIKAKGGYDHGFKFVDRGIHLLTLSTKQEDIALKIETNQSAAVVYLHAFAESDVQVNGHDLYQYAGIAIETQALPDAIHHKEFGDIILKAGQDYLSKTSYKLIR